MNNNQEEQFHILRDIKMSAIEKTEIRDSLMHFMAAHPLPRKIHKVWFEQGNLTISPYSGISMRMTKVLIFSFIGIIFAGGTLTFASGSSIPGEFLYPIKINIKEEIEGSLKTAPAEKLAWKEQRVTNRIEEIKILKSQKQVTKREATIAQAVLKKHVEELNQTFVEMKEDNQAAILATTAQLIPKTETILAESVATDVALMQTTATEEVTEAQSTPITMEAKIAPPVEENKEVVLDTINDADTESLKDALTQEVINQIQKIKDSAQSNTQETEEATNEPLETSSTAETGTLATETTTSVSTSANTASALGAVIDLTVIPLEIEKKEEPMENSQLETRFKTEVPAPASLSTKIKTSLKR